jgi:hexulose-6-phosphate isomerase
VEALDRGDPRRRAAREELGVRIAVENVWNNFLLSPLEANRYLDELGSDRSAGTSTSATCSSTAGPSNGRASSARASCSCTSRSSAARRWTSRPLGGFGVELGDGDNDWPAIMAALDEIAYDGWASPRSAVADAERLVT